MALPKYVSFTEVVSKLPFSSTHIRRLIAQGEFPKPVKLGLRRNAFVEQEIIDWIKAKRDGAAA